VKLFSAIFLFISLVMGIIVLFAVVNTMTMNVMERNQRDRYQPSTRRIAPRHSTAVRRGRLVARAVGASAGSALAFLIAAAVNHAGLTWLPPGMQIQCPCVSQSTANLGLIIGAWVGLVLIATIAAFCPPTQPRG